MGKKEDLTGRRFGMLTVVEETDKRKGNGVVWLCKCDCGNYKEVRANHLKRGAIISCGCYNKQKSFRHGLSDTRLHRTWACMLDRCTNPNAQEADRYIKRGIKVCDEWRNSFEAFAEWALANGFKETAERGKCTLDRIDNNGNYEPSNCRWVNMKVQARNRQNNVNITIDGEKHCLAEWAEILKEPYSKLVTRHRRGWSDKEILFGKSL